MAFDDARGAQLDINVTAAAGYNRTVTVLDDGVARDLTGITIAAVIKDDKSRSTDYGNDYGNETVVTMTATDAANGVFAFIIPPVNFANREGGRLSYEMYQLDSGSYTGLMWGYIDVQERG